MTQEEPETVGDWIKSVEKNTRAFELVRNVLVGVDGEDGEFEENDELVLVAAMPEEEVRAMFVNVASQPGVRKLVTQLILKSKEAAKECNKEAVIYDIESMKKHLPKLIQDIKINDGTVEFREEKERGDIGKEELAVCRHPLPFYYIDESRATTLAALAKWLEIDKFDDGRNHVFGIISGMGHGKSHLVDYISREFGAKNKKYEFLSVTATNVMSRQPGEDSEENLLAPIALRLLFRYFVKITPKNDKENGARLINAVWEQFYALINGKSRYELDFQGIIKSIDKEIKENDKVMVLMIDDLVGGFGHGREYKILSEMCSLGLRMIVTSTAQFNGREDMGPGKTDVFEDNEIGAIDLRNEIKSKLKEKGIILGKKGNFLLDMIKSGGRTFGCFWGAITEDEKFCQMCCNDDDGTMWSLLGLFLSKWQCGRYGPTNAFAVTLRSRINCYYIGGFIANMILDCGLPYKHAIWEKVANLLKEYGVINFKSGTIAMTPFMMYAWSEYARKMVDVAIKSKGSRNIASFVNGVFDRILVRMKAEFGEWNDKERVDLSIGLRLNCIKYLIEMKMIEPRSKYCSLKYLLQFDGCNYDEAVKCHHRDGCTVSGKDMISFNNDDMDWDTISQVTQLEKAGNEYDDFLMKMQKDRAIYSFAAKNGTIGCAVLLVFEKHGNRHVLVPLTKM